MKYSDMVSSAILELDVEKFEKLKSILVGDYLTFTVIDDYDVTKEILAEKLCDYFEKTELKTGKSFEKLLEFYLNYLDKIVSRKVPQSKKTDGLPPTPSRARRYYEKALSYKATALSDSRAWRDYNRIMLCLYTAIIDNDHREISNFDYAVFCLNPSKIVESMKKGLDYDNEQPILFGIKVQDIIKKDTGPYSLETCSLIFAILFLYKVIAESALGE